MELGKQHPPWLASSGRSCVSLADLQGGSELSALVQKHFAECLPGEVKLREERSGEWRFL